MAQLEFPMYITGDASPPPALSYTEKAAVMALDWWFCHPKYLFFNKTKL